MTGGRVVVGRELSGAVENKGLGADRPRFQRFRRQRFDPVTTRKLRLTVESTHGAPFARVFEIRAYGKETPFAG